MFIGLPVNNKARTRKAKSNFFFTPGELNDALHNPTVAQQGDRNGLQGSKFGQTGFGPGLELLGTAFPAAFDRVMRDKTHRSHV
jgi:hypothetical protein